VQPFEINSSALYRFSHKDLVATDWEVEPDEPREWYISFHALAMLMKEAYSSRLLEYPLACIQSWPFTQPPDDHQLNDWIKVREVIE
jgi:hypothetical protein